MENNLRGGKDDSQGLGEYGSNGLDPSILQEEMEWIREVKAQNSIGSSNHSIPPSMSTSTEEKTHKETDEITKIIMLQKQAEQKIQQAIEEKIKKQEELKKSSEDEEKKNSCQSSAISNKANYFGIDKSILDEEMEWVREVKAQNANEKRNDLMNNIQPALIEKDFPEERNESDKIMKLQKEIEEKINKAKEIPRKEKEELQIKNENVDDEELTTNISSSNYNGIDTSILQEEMEWVKEMKAQNQSTNNNEKENKKCEQTVKVEVKSMKNNELDMILSLQKQVEDKINKSKMVKEAELDTFKGKESDQNCSINEISPSEIQDESSILEEELGWVKEVKCQNAMSLTKTKENINSSKEIFVPGIRMSKTDEFDSWNSNIQYNKINTHETNDNFHEVKQEEKNNIIEKENNNSITSQSTGIDSKIIQEEMEWVREMKLQNNCSVTTTNSIKLEDTKENSSKLNTPIAVNKNAEALKIANLEAIINAKLESAKAEKESKIQERRKQEELELQIRIAEEVQFAEEMKAIAEEGRDDT